jgi:hypothetical protein
LSKQQVARAADRAVSRQGRRAGSSDIKQSSEQQMTGFSVQHTTTTLLYLIGEKSPLFGKKLGNFCLQVEERVTAANDLVRGGKIIVDKGEEGCLFYLEEHNQSSGNWTGFKGQGTLTGTSPLRSRQGFEQMKKGNDRAKAPGGAPGRGTKRKNAQEHKNWPRSAGGQCSSLHLFVKMNY